MGLKKEKEKMSHKYLGYQNREKVFRVFGKVVFFLGGGRRRRKSDTIMGVSFFFLLFLSFSEKLRFII